MSNISHNHRAKAVSNRQVVQNLLTSTTYFDWVVTIAFYTALHLVTSVITSTGRRSPTSHHERNRIVASDRRFQNIQTSYLLLYQEARAARYDPEYQIQRTDVEQLVNNELARIEREFP